jgi:hypothetical protein
MDPQVKLALEAQTRSFLAELDKKFAALDTKWESRIGDLERSAAAAADQFYDLKADIHTDVTAQLEFFVHSATERSDQIAAATASRVEVLESASASFDAWRPGIESSMADVKVGIESVREAVAKLARPWDPSPPVPAYLQPGILGEFGSAPARPTAGCRTNGPAGHGIDSQRREAGFGRVYASTHLPPNGTLQFNSPQFTHLLGSPHNPVGDHSAGFGQSSNYGPLPKVPFPPFDGDNPRLWIRRSEDYFDLYNVDPASWIRISTMHFTGPAARWWQSVGARLRFCTWSEFSKVLLERFGRDQHEYLIRQLFHIRQTTSIAAYIE